MMAAAERVDKFQIDSQTLLKSNNHVKIISEMKKLSQWLQKHQSEIIPDNHKQILLGVIESYYTYYCSSIQNREATLLDAVSLLVDDCLKLPEGKLINSKGKKKALKWIDTLNSLQSTDGNASSTDRKLAADTSSTTSESFIVISLQQHNKSISVMDEETGERVIENIPVTTSSQWKALKQHFAKTELTDVMVYLSETEQIVKIVIDGSEVA